MWFIAFAGNIPHDVIKPAKDHVIRKGTKTEKDYSGMYFEYTLGWRRDSF
jgi:hypothetical protein